MAETNTITTKRCYGCKISLPLANFNKNKSKKDGLASECRSCTKQAGKIGYARHKERRDEGSRKYRAENLEARRAYDREYSKTRDKEKTI